ncbi:RluA family pseudouridine synthase [Helicobacter turcicus]|uniref:Pseudouridine synthase n=1 Tax=Helicobacter turcicus TaxID=2867412 RepID=A0ABS7JKK6_9HELI|nr:RluA family pseudouridine synthase [Helicobacter turcicus]MBX7489922.1 RluA family pseudouridine synthase [Helicobacter turcicus]MBX7544782.1 RluA family pseudouridine synthase [Helicobacter turcicus]
MQQNFKQMHTKISNIFTIDNKNKGIRADIFLSHALNISRSKVQNLINKKAVLLNSSPLNKYGATLNTNDTLMLISPTESKKDSSLKNLNIPILYEDSDILILNKPTNLIVHRTHEKDLQFTLVDYLRNNGFKLSNLGDSYRLGIVHRLDKNTSGAIVIAKNNVAHENLSKQIKTRQMGRYYLCMIDKPLKASQIVEFPIMRHPKHRLKYITTNPNNTTAKRAKTVFFEIPNLYDSTCDSTFSSIKTEIPTLIGAKLFTGRTHQIRVHLNAINRHILGDAFYNYKGSYTGRILLHAHFLHLFHPKTQKPLEFYAPIPTDMQDFLHTHFNVSTYQNTENPKLITIPLAQIYQQQFRTI